MGHLAVLPNYSLLPNCFSDVAIPAKITQNLTSSTAVEAKFESALFVYREGCRSPKRITYVMELFWVESHYWA